MAKDETNTYSKAKDIYNSLGLKDEILLHGITAKDAAIFRKHLSEIMRRQNYSKQFATRFLNKSQLRVIRIN